ncbi:MAG: UvrD-helicase domain-containing protein [Bacteroidia bacterium]|nr:UvrD-helicase domain-containing protein [Bacteroidia bacterium]MDW8057341.1 UvrD-helicase domain-containing protein [Bacteroidia bacterium]
MNWQEHLDPQQWEAVSHISGPAIVLAGAGSGKTRVLTYRIAYLLSQGVSPHQILALTFTNKAADTMRQRIAQLIGNAALMVRMGTFHSIFAQWLRRELNGVPVSRNFTIYDEDDSRALIRAILKEMGHDTKRAPTIRSIISRWKNEGISWQKVQPHSTTIERIAAQVYERYDARLRAAQALDFDDLLLETERLFLREPAILEQYQTRYQHILVDEYQDTNPLQYRILRLLASKHRNLFVVGDDAQSIYRFRGADIRNFRYLERDFAPVKIIRLEQNYRSTPQILSLANNLLRHSQELYKKELFTRNASGPEPLIHTGCLNAREEALFVVNKIREEMARYHLSYRDFAILYRTNAYSRAFEEELRAARIPYRLIGAISFYQREEVKHFLAFLRFILNPDDEQALLRIIAVRGAGIGESTIEKLTKLAEAQRVSLWQILPLAAKEMKGAPQRALEAFYVRMLRFREKLLPLPLTEQVALALEESGLLEYYREAENGRERIDNLQAVVASAKDFILQVGEGASLREFLERVALVSATDDPKEGAPDAVWLSTVHGVKGLEFHTVFVVGVIEGYFPHSYAHEEGMEALEEERRIFYVALTRAMRHLYILQPQYDTRHGGAQPAIPSRFLQEIKPAESSKTRPALIGRLRAPVVSAPSGMTWAFPPEEAAPPSEILPGRRVQHTHFGYGQVLSREENGAAGIVEVLFDTYGKKKLDLRHAKFRVLS